MKYYTVKQVAEILQVKERTVCHWINQGKILASKLGGSKLFRISEDSLNVF